jgi:hypothetical protein
LRVPPAADAGWRLLQLAELLRQLESHQDRLLTILRRLEPSVDPGFSMKLKRAHVEELHRGIDGLTDLVEQAAALIDGVAFDALEIGFDELADRARPELARGDALDARRVVLSARLLRFEIGWPALAEGLRTSEVHMSWQGTTVSDVLSAFRGATPQLVRRVATAAGLAPGAELANCSADAIARLADQLDERSRA